MMTCPLFRSIAFETIKARLCCKKQSDKKDESGDFDELLNRYNNTNSFLYSSLNMEIVCSILKGINIVLREINSFDKKSKMMLNFGDFKEKKKVTLESIQVLNRKYFENIAAGELKVH